VWIGALVLSMYVVASGIHGSAWTAAIKDVLTLSVVVFIGLYLPIHYFGSIGAMFRASRTPSRASRALGRPADAGVVLLDGAADRARVLHVAAHVRLRADAPGRERLPAQRDRSCRSTSC
jgi:Na+(H+)/acetate symporter ActP